MGYIDLTRVLSEKTVVYPGDPPFVREQLSYADLEKAGSFTLYHLHMSNRQGTHVDFPAHLIPHGKTSSDYTIDDLIGEGCIVEIPRTLRRITAEFIASQNLKPKDIVFFKTINSEISEDSLLVDDYVCLDEGAAAKLVQIGVKAVGLDSLSVDSHDAKDLPVHQLLLKNGILIVEGLNLGDASPGRGEMIIAPLKISAIDGAPARVLMKQ